MRRLLGLLVWLLGGFIFLPLIEILLWRRLWLRNLPSAPASAKPWRRGLLYLSGISDFTTAELLPNQRKALDTIAKLSQPDVSLRLTYPYETTTPQDFLRIDPWRKLGYARTPVAGYALRNMWQGVLGAWFPNWYGAAIAKALRAQLGEAATDAKLIVLGNSSGASILVAAAPFLRQWWPGLEIVAIMCGGCFGSNPGFDEIAEFHQLLGTRDHVVKVAYALATSLSKEGTAFARARADGRYHERLIGNQTHFGSQGYFSDAHYAATEQALIRIIGEHLR